MHADWELLTIVVPPDVGLEFEDGVGPSGPASVLVAGTCCRASPVRPSPPPLTASVLVVLGGA
jgi:hypothetical protein